jgi:nicotinamidase/pyrazinamidase
MKALILVDLQNDFLPGGALPVPDGDEVVPVANRVLQHFGLVVATQDWHPADHASFADNHDGKQPGDVVDVDGLEQVLWPIHCLEGTKGAELVEGLHVKRIAQVFRKGTDPRIDSYSGFFDNGRRKSTGLGDYLKGKGVSEVYILGLATDYCVKHTALDAVQLGFRCYVVEDGCRGVNLNPGDVSRAYAEMTGVGVVSVRSAEISA